MGQKVPSPCIDVCKFRRGDHCIGCSMDKKQKKQFKKLGKRKKQLGVIVELIEQQKEMGGYAFWEKAYRKRCRKKDAACPLDELESL